ncbi:hypothetical protein ACLB1E_24110 [Escherichia coli]
MQFVNVRAQEHPWSVRPFISGDILYWIAGRIALTRLTEQKD